LKTISIEFEPNSCESDKNSYEFEANSCEFDNNSHESKKIFQELGDWPFSRSQASYSKFGSYLQFLLIKKPSARKMVEETNPKLIVAFYK